MASTLYVEPGYVDSGYVDSGLTDTLEALIVFLRAQTNVTDMTSTRIFGLELPRAEIRLMPRHSVLIRWAGGLNVGLPTALHSWRFDVWCYGTTSYEAMRLYRSVYPSLKGLNREVRASTLVHVCQESGGPLPIREPDTMWPAIVQSWSVISDDRVVA